jgi:hypothetical protein
MTPIDMTTFGPYRRGPEKMIQKKKRKSKDKNRHTRTRMQAKANSPGVPPNTCPYIDLAITMVQDLNESYEKLRTSGHYNPMMDEITQHAQDTLEYVRKANETLRDNSAYWYNKYKDLLERQ